MCSAASRCATAQSAMLYPLPQNGIDNTPLVIFCSAVSRKLGCIEYVKYCTIYGLQLSAHTGDVELTKLLTLKQYLHIYSEIKRHVSDASYFAAKPQFAVDTARANVLDASVIMMQYVITLLRKPSLGDSPSIIFSIWCLLFHLLPVLSLQCWVAYFLQTFSAPCYNIVLSCYFYPSSQRPVSLSFCNQTWYMCPRSCNFYRAMH